MTAAVSAGMGGPGPDSDSDEDICPICCEELDITDRNFLPCPCGYQICMFCWKQIKDIGNGQCPACRREYDSEPTFKKELTEEEIMLEHRERKRKAKLKKQSSVPTGTGGSSVPIVRSTSAPGSTGAARGGSGRVIQKNLVFVVNLPPAVAREQVIRKPRYFGQYGTILRVVTKRSENSAYITYAREEEAQAAIDAVNGFSLDGVTIKACFGTTMSGASNGMDAAAAAAASSSPPIVPEDPVLPPPPSVAGSNVGGGVGGSVGASGRREGVPTASRASAALLMIIRGPLTATDVLNSATASLLGPYMVAPASASHVPREAAVGGGGDVRPLTDLYFDESDLGLGDTLGASVADMDLRDMAGQTPLVDEATPLGIAQQEKSAPLNHSEAKTNQDAAFLRALANLGSERAIESLFHDGSSPRRHSESVEDASSMERRGRSTDRVSQSSGPRQESESSNRSSSRTGADDINGKGRKGRNRRRGGQRRKHRGYAQHA